MTDKPTEPLKLTRYMVPGGQGVEAHPAGLLYRRDEVDPMIAKLAARLSEVERERDAAKENATVLAEFRANENRRARAAEAKLARAREGLVKIANAPSEMTWGESDEVRRTLGRVEGIAEGTLAQINADTPAPVTVGEAALLVADEIDKDPNAFNALQAGFKPDIDAPMRHFFSKALRHYAAALRSLAGEKGDE